MGINICIQSNEGERHPEWDDLCYGGDRRFASDFLAVPRDEWTPDGFPWADDRILYRPTDIDAFRRLAETQDWPERWHNAADIFNSGPEWWFWFSY